MLIRNIAIKKALNQKMCPCYLGLMVVISKNKGDVYIICDLDSMLAHSPVTAFRIVPYFARENIDLLNLEQHIEVSAACLRELENATTTNPDYLEPHKEYSDAAKVAKVAEDTVEEKAEET